MTATLSSAFAGLFFSSSSQLPLSRRLQTLTLIPSSYSSSTPIVSRFPRESMAVLAAWRGVEKDSSTEERIDFDSDEGPTSIELVPIAGEEQFDRVVAEAQQLEESIVVLWMAKWCRKCIYLKPKLEKLAADYHPRIRFYCVDVNSVPQKLVNRAEIIKMPTIQLWKDSQKQAEVIGGHKAWLVIDEVRRMVKDED